MKSHIQVGFKCGRKRGTCVLSSIRLFFSVSRQALFPGGRREGIQVGLGAPEEYLLPRYLWLLPLTWLSPPKFYYLTFFNDSFIEI
jgi:hypothetical protein